MKNKSNVWLKRNERIANEMEKFAKNFRCKKCSEDYCNHMLNVRGRKFKERIDAEFSLLVNC